MILRRFPCARSEQQKYDLMRGSYYSAPVSDFLETPENSILGELARAHHHALEHEQRGAWIRQIQLLKQQLHGRNNGHLFFEFSIPRMGKRADVLVLAEGVVFVIEFKVGSTSFDRSAIDQAHDYALDLKNFHLGSHDLPIVPVLVATRMSTSTEICTFRFRCDPFERSSFQLSSAKFWMATPPVPRRPRRSSAAVIQ